MIIAVVIAGTTAGSTIAAEDRWLQNNKCPESDLLRALSFLKRLIAEFYRWRRYGFFAVGSTKVGSKF